MPQSVLRDGHRQSVEMLHERPAAYRVGHCVLEVEILTQYLQNHKIHLSSCCLRSYVQHYILIGQRVHAHILAVRETVRMQPLDANAVAPAERQIVHFLHIRNDLESGVHRPIVANLGAGQTESPRDLRAGPVVAGLDELVHGFDLVVEPGKNAIGFL